MMYAVRWLVAVLAVMGLVAGGRPARADLLVGNYDGGNILRFNESNGSFIDVFVPAAEIGSPAGIAYGPDGNAYVASFGGSKVTRFDRNTGAFLDDFVVAESGGLNRPQGIAFGPDGNLYVANFAFGPAILRYNGITGAFMDVLVDRGVGGILQPFGTAFGPDGNLYVSELQTSKVFRIDRTNGTILGSFNAGGTPTGLAFGPDGNVYVANEADRAVLAFEPLTGTFLRVAAAGPELSNPRGVAFGPDGNLYVSNGNGIFNGEAGPSQILRFDPNTGGFIDVFASGNGLSGPRFLAFSSVPEPSSLTLLALTSCVVGAMLCRRGLRDVPPAARTGQVKPP